MASRFTERRHCFLPLHVKNHAATSDEWRHHHFYSRDENLSNQYWAISLSLFQSSIRQEIPLLVYLDPLDCNDARIFKVSWFLELIFIVLCSTFQNGCSSWVFWVKQFEVALFRLSVIGLLFTKRWRKNIDLPFCTVAPPRPRHRFRVIFHLTLVMCGDKWCNWWHFNHTSVGLTWGNILTVNRHCESSWVLHFGFCNIRV